MFESPLWIFVYVLFYFIVLFCVFFICICFFLLLFYSFFSMALSPTIDKHLRKLELWHLFPPFNMSVTCKQVNVTNQSTESTDGNDFFYFLALMGILFSGAEHFVHFCRGHYEEHFCEVLKKF